MAAEEEVLRELIRLEQVNRTLTRNEMHENAFYDAGHAVGNIRWRSGVL
jgi:hypothetical protein